MCRAQPDRPKPAAQTSSQLSCDRYLGELDALGADICISTFEHRHDLAALKEPLRSHGGLTEQEVAFIVNRVLPLSERPVLRNFDAFFYATEAAAL